MDDLWIFWFGVVGQHWMAGSNNIFPSSHLEHRVSAGMILQRLPLFKFSSHFFARHLILSSTQQMPLCFLVRFHVCVLELLTIDLGSKLFAWNIQACIYVFSLTSL